MICCFQVVCGQQNYFDYHSKINQAEELFTNEEFSKSVELYDSVFQEFEYVFLKDYIIAAQIAILSNDTHRTTEWLEKALANGYDCECLKKIKVFDNYLKTADWKTLEANDKNLKITYKQNIDLDLHYEFHSRFKQEQEHKGQRNKYVAIVTNNYNKIKSLMDSIPFPSERVIGIDHQSIYPTTHGGKLNNCEVSNSKVIATMLHYDNPITDIGLSKFMNAIQTGHLHPRQFASIYSFETNYVSRVSKNKHKNPPRLPEYWFNFSFGKQINDIELVNQYRTKFGISSIEIDKAKEEIAHKLGLKVYFGYK